MFTPIGNILPETVKKNGMAAKVARAKAFTSFEEAALSLLPRDTEPGFKVLRFSDGTLTVACKSSSIVAVLRKDEALLLETVKKAGGDRIRFLLSPWR
ncbi:MAG: DciA family protein [Patescibacteria group bacterium]|nr:MAG: DciA family protein [Patescibacteria group bacterium]